MDWRPLTDAIKEFSGEFGEAMAALTDGMDLSSVEGLRNLLQALINLMGNFTQYIAGVVDGLEPFLDSLNILLKPFRTTARRLPISPGKSPVSPLQRTKCSPQFHRWAARFLARWGRSLNCL
ncbi:MAG: hypothetical protein IPL51_05455 [Candidatus Competibacteraceae bacterium]|nr:hypothetical protein [Candidatus Competibacteraceae bacterium]